MNDNQENPDSNHRIDTASKFSPFWWIATACICIFALLGSTTAQTAIFKGIFLALFFVVIFLIRKALNKIPAINRSTQKKANAKARMNKHAEEGGKAFSAGISREANPYQEQGDPESAELASFWDRGYDAAQRIEQNRTKG